MSTDTSHQHERSFDRLPLGAFLGSRGFAYLTYLLFAVQASWIALVARYSIYDEPYHVAAVGTFSLGWTPFIDQDVTPAISDQERYGSYLYHYVLSFAWRATTFLNDDWDRVVVLRLITVLMVVAGLMVYRRVFRELGASRAVANLAILAVSLTPLLVFVASSVNYDNLVFLMLGLLFLVAVRLYQSETFSASLWLQLILVGSLGAVTKYTFLPVLAPVVVVLIVRQVIVARHDFRPALGAFFSLSAGRYLLIGRILLLATALGALALVIERYVVNVLVYGALVPDCGSVQTVEVCRAFSPWARNQDLDGLYPDDAPSIVGLVTYASSQWSLLMLNYMTLLGVFDISGVPLSTIGPHIAGVVLVALVPVVLAMTLVALLKRPRGAASMVVVACAFYLVVLFLQNYSDFRKLGEPLGIQGRYALVVLPVVIGLAFVGVSRILEAYGPLLRRRVGALLVIGMVALATQGGGMLSFLQVVEPSWYQYPDATRSKITEQLGRLADVVVLPDTVVRDPR